MITAKEPIHRQEDVTKNNPQEEKEVMYNLGYSGRTALRREQCDVLPESQNIGADQLNTFPPQCSDEWITTE
jgi:hypothetical protein